MYANICETRGINASINAVLQTYLQMHLQMHVRPEVHMHLQPRLQVHPANNASQTCLANRSAFAKNI